MTQPSPLMIVKAVLGWFKGLQVKQPFMKESTGSGWQQFTVQTALTIQFETKAISTFAGKMFRNIKGP